MIYLMPTQTWRKGSAALYPLNCEPLCGRNNCYCHCLLQLNTDMRPLWLSWLTLAGFTLAFLILGNSEFLLYAVTLSILIALVQWSNRRLSYPAGVLWCFWLWLVMHMCGGFVHIHGVRLYDVILVPLVGAPYHILRYDQVVHAFCYFALGGLLKTIVTALVAPAPRGMA